MSKKTFTLIDTSNTGLEYKDYVENCELNEITPHPENSTEYWEWIAEQRNNNVEDFFLNLKYMRDATPVVVTGTLGLWNGKRSIYPMYIESKDYELNSQGKWVYMEKALYTAIQKCINGMDDFKVEYVEGEIVVHGYHHDGTNTFTIHKLSTKGQIAAFNAYCNCKTLKPKGYWYAKYREEDLF